MSYFEFDKQLEEVMIGIHRAYNVWGRKSYSVQVKYLHIMPENATISTINLRCGFGIFGQFLNSEVCVTPSENEIKQINIGYQPKTIDKLHNDYYS